MSLAPRALAAMLVVAAVFVVPAAAEHEVYYRFTVLGYVKDARGKPTPLALVDRPVPHAVQPGACPPGDAGLLALDVVALARPPRRPVALSQQ